MKPFLFIGTVVILLGLLSCHKDQPVVKKPPVDSNSCDVMLTLPLKDTTPHTDPFTIKSWTISGDYLKLTVSYGGGCKSHDFRLVWNQLAMPPFPVIHLEHNANGDLCKALITTNLCYNISVLREDGPPHGEIDFPLSDSSGNTFQVKYVY
jgi:hypothetical protein